MIGNKIADRITKVLKNSQQNNSGTVINEYDKEISRGRYISPEERQEIINKLRTEIKIVKWCNIKISQNIQKIYNKIIQRHLQMKAIKKCLKKDIYLQKKDKKLLIILLLI